MTKTYYVLDVTRPDSEPGYAVMYVTPAEHWNTEQCQADWTDQDVLDELGKANFYVGELMDGTLAIKTSELGQLTQFLENHPDFEENIDFAKYMME